MVSGCYETTPTVDALSEDCSQSRQQAESAAVKRLGLGIMLWRIPLILIGRVLKPYVWKATHSGLGRDIGRMRGVRLSGAGQVE